MGLKTEMTKKKKEIYQKPKIESEVIQDIAYGSSPPTVPPQPVQQLQPLGGQCCPQPPGGN